MGEKFGGEWIRMYIYLYIYLYIYIYIYMIEFLCCPPETVTTLLVIYTPI